MYITPTVLTDGIKLEVYVQYVIQIINQYFNNIIKVLDLNEEYGIVVKI
jgi:hypothetical protein